MGTFFPVAVVWEAVWGCSRTLHSALQAEKKIGKAGGGGKKIFFHMAVTFGI